MRVIAAALGAAVLAASAFGPAEAGNTDTLSKILKRGKVVIGVKADYKPWGFRDSSGKLVGMEVDLARDVAEALGVRLEAVPVQSSNRMQFLQQGKVDMFIATMSDRPDRRRVVGIPEPNYYSSGTNVLAKRGAVKAWSDLQGKPVCGKQGAFYNKIVASRHGAKIVAFVGNAEAKQALKDGRCIAWVYDDSSIMADLASGSWDGYEMPLPTEDPTPWSLAVPLSERDALFGRFMTGMVYHWHASGRLIELESKWGIQPSDFLQQMHEKFRYDGAHLQ